MVLDENHASSSIAIRSIRPGGNVPFQLGTTACLFLSNVLMMALSRLFLASQYSRLISSRLIGATSSFALASAIRSALEPNVKL